MSEVNMTEAARLVGVNERTMRRWVKAGKLPSRRRGREKLVNVEQARALLAAEPVKYRRLAWRLYWRRDS